MIKNLKKAAERISAAVGKREKIILYGDSDLDGVTSVIILKETIQSLGGTISSIYFPDREKEGYGITKRALEVLGSFSPALLIAVDCGISNFEEIKEAKEMGFSVIVIDHHQVIDKVPEADIVVDPKQKGDKHPFKEFAAAGLAFKLAEKLLEGKISSNLRRSFVELTALATMADMMPKEGENRLFIEEGMEYLEDSWRPGIKKLFGADFLCDYDQYQKVFKVISLLNVRDVEDGFPSSFRLLTISSEKEAERIIQKLKSKNQERREKIEKTTAEVANRVTSKKEPIIFEGDARWEYPLISSAASIICKEFKKPTFIYKKMEEESQGTVRVPSNIDSVALMKKCSQYVITYGGHAPASGFRILNDNIEKFKKCLMKHYEEDNNIH